MSTFNALSIGVFGSYLNANGAEKGSERQYGKPSYHIWIWQNVGYVRGGINPSLMFF